MATRRICRRRSSPVIRGALPLVIFLCACIRSECLLTIPLRLKSRRAEGTDGTYRTHGTYPSHWTHPSHWSHWTHPSHSSHPPLQPNSHYSIFSATIAP